MKNYITKDSGKRISYDTGMVRDTQEGKPDFSLILPLEMPYERQLLTRWAELMSRGVAKYGYRNWEKARTTAELLRFKASAFRHFMQWFCNLDDEDHAVAVCFNINSAEYVKWRLEAEESKKNA